MPLRPTLHWDHLPLGRGRWACLAFLSWRLEVDALTCLLGLTLVGTSCVDDPGEAAPAETGDRSGTLVLELTLGDVSAAAPREYQFAGIQDILVADKGTIWVLDGEDVQLPLLRQYDPNGDYLRQVGRKGAGPGEYLDPDGLALMPDGRVALRDAGLPGRITLYHADGSLDTVWSLGRDLRWPSGGRSPIRVDMTGVSWLPFTRGRPGPNRGSPRFLRVRPDGTVLDTVPFPSVPEVERDRLRIVRTLPSGGTSTRGFTIPYQARGLFAWSPFGNFAVFRTDRYRLDMLPPPGGWGPQAAFGAKVIERSVPPIPVPEAERAAVRKQLVREVSAVEGGDGIRVPEIPTHKPPIRAVNFTDDGQVLVSVSMPSRLRDGEWTEPHAVDVFDGSGRFTGRVVLPDSFTVLYMRGSHLWGVFRETDGIESVRQYEIVWR